MAKMQVPIIVANEADEPEEVTDFWCDPDKPRVVPFELVTSAAYRIRDGILKTPCDVRFFTFEKILEFISALSVLY